MIFFLRKNENLGSLKIGLPPSSEITNFDYLKYFRSQKVFHFVLSPTIEAASAQRWGGREKEKEKKRLK